MFSLRKRNSSEGASAYPVPETDENSDSGGESSVFQDEGAEVTSIRPLIPVQSSSSILLNDHPTNEEMKKGSRIKKRRSIFQRITKVVEQFMPNSALQTDNNEREGIDVFSYRTYVSTYMVIVICFVMSPMTVYGAYQWLSLRGLHHVTISMTVHASILTSIPWLMKYPYMLEIGGLYSCLSFMFVNWSVVLDTGGYNSHAMCMVLIPILLSQILGSRATALVTTLLVFSMGLFQFIFPPVASHLAPEEESTLGFVALVVSLVMTYLFLYMYEGVFLHVADRLKNTIMQLHETRKALIQSDQRKQEFMSYLCHEIRGPLHIILAMCEFVSSEDSSQEEKEEGINSIRQLATMMTAISNDVLDLSKIESKGLDLETVVVRSESILKNVITCAGYGCSRKVELKLEVGEPGNASALPPPLIEVDPLRLSQILNNLLSNAVKFTQKGFISLKCKRIGPFIPDTVPNLYSDVKDRRSRVWSYVRFEVEDTGCGISHEERKNLFQPYRQANSSVTRKHGGTGLGLVISSLLTSSMGGKLEMTSEVGVGSRFFFTIPVLHGVEKGPLRNVSVGQAAVFFGSRTSPTYHKDDGESESKSNYLDTESNGHCFPHIRKVLAVDDNPINIKILRRILLSLLPATTVIEEAHNGMEAVDKVKAIDKDGGSFDLIFMDVSMPVMDGYTATEQIRRVEGAVDTGIIALTANALSSERGRAMESGMDGFISKPFNRKHLVEALSFVDTLCQTCQC